MGKASRGKQADNLSRRDRVEAMRAEDAKHQRRRNLLTGLVAVVAVALVAGLTYWGIQRTTSDRDTLALEVSTYDQPAQPAHNTQPITYPQTPPVGGDHDPVWLNCGIYDQPVRSENAVHALEHGAVWVTYDPSLPADQVERLRERMPSTYVILSPYEGLPAPVVASAWGVQLTLDGVDDPRLSTFIDVYRQGSQTPEPGAACDGGTGTPTG